MRYERESRPRLGIVLGIGVILVLIILIYATAHPRPQVSVVEVWLREGLAPVQQVFKQIGHSLNRSWQQIVHWSRLERENARYQEQIDRLQEQLTRMTEYAQENKRLRSLLAFQDQIAAEFDLVAARVVAQGTTNWTSTVTIDKGQASGIRPQMAVISPAGVVGWVQTVTPHTATVLLLLDSKAAVGGRVQRTRSLVLVEGNPKQAGSCLVKGLTADVKIAPNDVLVTSGLGDIFPPGLRIGEVIQIEREGRYGLTPTGLIKPAVDFTRLEEVLIIRNVKQTPEDRVWPKGDKD